MRRPLIYIALLLATACVALLVMRSIVPRFAARTQPAMTSGPDQPASPANAVSQAAFMGPSRRVTLEVGGMVCEACSLKVTRSLTAVPGMRSTTGGGTAATGAARPATTGARP